MKIHPNELIVTTELVLEAEQLGQKYLDAIKIQERRQALADLANLVKE